MSDVRFPAGGPRDLGCVGTYRNNTSQPGGHRLQLAPVAPAQPATRSLETAYRVAVPSMRQPSQTTITVLMVGACAFVILRTSLLLTPEVFPLGSEIGELVYDLSIAYATAWFFQWLVISRPARQRRRRLNQIVARRLDKTLDLGLEVGSRLTLAAGLGAKEFPYDPNVVRSACKSLDPTSEPPDWGVDWHGMLADVIASADHNRAGLRSFYASVDESTLALLEDEEERALVLARTVAASEALHWATMENWARPLNNWLDTLNALMNHRISHLAPEHPAPRLSVTRGSFVRVPLRRVVEMRDGK